MDHLPKKANDDALMELRWLYDRRDLEEARRDLGTWLERWQERHPRLCEWVEEHIEETFTFYRQPRAYHKHLKSTNMLERLNQELKRRTRACKIFCVNSWIGILNLKMKVYLMKEKIKDELIEELLKNYESPEDLLGSGGLLNELKKRLIEKVMDVELSTDLGYQKHEKGAAKQLNNSRNGRSKKTIRTNTGELQIEVPRDRKGDYEPLLIPKHERHFDGFDEVIVSLYSRGLTVREIQEHLKELYAVEVSPTLISNVTNGIIEEVKAWQNRPLDEVYL